jgi:hypothetical protein
LISGHDHPWRDERHSPFAYEGAAVTNAEGPDTTGVDGFEGLDEDMLGVDPFEEGIEPPERWSAADRFGTTPAEQARGQDLEHRLREEEPDIDPSALPQPAGANTPIDLLDESIDDQDDLVQVEELPLAGEPPRASRRGQAADEAGGSVADALRTPPDEPT